MKKLFTLRNIALYSAVLFSVIAVDYGFRKVQETLVELHSDTEIITSLRKEVSDLKRLSEQIVLMMPVKSSVATGVTAYPEPVPFPSPMSNFPIKPDEHNVKLAAKDAPDSDKITLLGDDMKAPTATNSFSLLGDK